MGNELAQPRLGLLARPAGRVAEVELDARLGWDDVRGDAALDPDGAHDLTVDQSVELDVERFETHELLEAAHELVDRIHAGPGTRRVCTLAVEGDARLDVPEAAGVQEVVGRLEHDRELGAGEEVGCEEPGQRALGDGHLLACEEDVAPRQARARELDHHGDTALHVARAEPVHGAVLDPAGDVPLGGDRVEMPGEDDRRGRIAVEQHLAVVVVRRTGDEPADEADEVGLATALRRDVDELERPGCEV